jgi:hypothetical protein
MYIFIYFCFYIDRSYQLDDYLSLYFLYIFKKSEFILCYILNTFYINSEYLYILLIYNKVFCKQYILIYLNFK